MEEKVSLAHSLGSHRAELALDYQNNGEQHSRFVFFHVIVKNLAILFFCFAMMMIAALCSVFLGDNRTVGLILVALAVVPAPFMVLSAYFYSKRYLKRHAEYAQGKNYYRFYEGLLYIRTENSFGAGEDVIGYASLFRVYETVTNLYLYLTKNRAVILDKQQIAGSDLNKLYDILERGVPKRRICAGFLFLMHSFRRVK